MEADWICIKECNNPIEAELLKAYLEENNVQVIIFNKRDSAYQMFGQVNVLVNQQDYDVAVALLAIINQDLENG